MVLNLSSSSDRRYYKIVSSMDNYSTILTRLREEGVTFETDGGFELLPLTPVEVRQYNRLDSVII